MTKRIKDENIMIKAEQSFKSRLFETSKYLGFNSVSEYIRVTMTQNMNEAEIPMDKP